MHLDNADDGLQLRLVHVIKVDALGQVAAQLAVPVLFGPALPGGIGVGEPGVHAQGINQLEVAGKLGAAVVGSHSIWRRAGH